MTAMAATAARRTARVGVRRERHEVAYPLLIAVIGLVAIGVVMVYSASSVRSYLASSDPAAQGLQQAIWAVLGLAAMYVASRIDFRLLRYLAIPLYLITMVLLVAPGFLLIAMEPDLGTAGIYAATAFAIFFMAGANLLYLGAIASAVVGAAVLMISTTAYQMDRVQTFLDPFRDPLDKGYNTIQGLLALALGGLMGQGLGASKLKYMYLPAPSTDFIFAIIGEEWGIIGTLTVLILFLLIAYHGYRTAIHAPDTFSGLLAAGLTTWLVAQACINMMVVTALMPVTGIPLPFISYGGSALTINLVAVGILLSISRETSQTGSLLDALSGLGRRDRRARVPRAGRRAGAARRAARA
jgi:cell division protein FtsW (lipid II flippase)